MRVQVVSFSGTETVATSLTVEKTKFENAKSFSEFDFNIISLQNKDIWRYNGSNVGTVNCINNLKSLNVMIKNCNKPVFVFMPQNYEYLYYYENAYEKYRYSIQLKDMLDVLCEIIRTSLLRVIPERSFQFVYENCNTVINKLEICSHFAFKTSLEGVTKSKTETVKTTIVYGENVTLSTLTLSELCIDDFFKEIGATELKSKAPEWANDVLFFNDSELKGKLDEKFEQRSAIEKDIEETELELVKNQKYKSVLYTNGDELVGVVFEILQEILDYNLEEFEDIKKEDFLIKKDSVTFVGEIKGVTSNVKSEFISQVDVHLQGYSDKLAEDGTEENLKSILIVNPFRTKAPCDREEVNEKQIALAERNNCLIITTEMLLKLYESFLQKQITCEGVIELLLSKSGLLGEGDF